MFTIRSIVRTTRVDRHGDCFTLEALESAAAQMKAGFLPMLFNHDPRHPPLGRTVDAYVEQLDDGEWALIAESEIFDTTGVVPPLSSDREIAIHAFPLDCVTIVSDRSYRHPEDRAILEEVASHLPAHLEVQEKKALEPLSVLIIGLSAAAATFTAGFLNKMGGDTWDYLRTKIKELLARRRADQAEFLLVLEIQVQRSSTLLSVQCILSSPTAEDLEEFWAEGFGKLEALLPMFIDAPEEIRRVVVAYKGGKLEGLFAVRSDCIGLHIKLPEMIRAANPADRADGNRKQRGSRRSSA